MADERTTFDPDTFTQPLREQFEVFLDEHRRMLDGCLDSLSEEEARLQLVGSKTTLLGLVKHATFVEQVWFGEAIAHRPRGELGVAASPDESFDIATDDTVDSVRSSYSDACDESRRLAAGLDLDDVVTGNRRGPLPLRWVYLHLLRELAQHCGHADILREMILDRRAHSVA